MHTTWTGWKTDPMEIPRCPRCKAALTEDTEVCPACNLRFSEISLYDPKHFMWLGVLFSFVVPCLLGALNYGRLGRPNLKKAWLVGGLAGFTILVAVVMYLDEFLVSQMGSTGDHRDAIIKWGGYFINLAVAGYIYRRQRALFRGALELGMKKASLLKGALGGIGIMLGISVAVGFSIGLVSGLATSSLPNEIAVLLSEHRYAEADQVLDRLLAKKPTDPELLYYKATCRTAALVEAKRFADALLVVDRMLARHPGDGAFLLWKGVCHMGQEEWADAEQAYRACLPDAKGTPEIYVFLGTVCWKQGKSEETSRFFALAEEASPGLVKKITGLDWTEAAN